MSSSQSCSRQQRLMKLTALPVYNIFCANSLLRKDGIIMWLRLYFWVHSFSSGTVGSVSTKNSRKGSLISPSIIHVLIIDRIGADTSLRILFMNYYVLGLPFMVKVLIAEQMAPPFRFCMESIMMASHFILSNGS